MTAEFPLRFFLLFSPLLCMLLAGCIHQPVEIIPPANQKVSVKMLHTPSEQIFTCLENSIGLSAEQLSQKYDKTQKNFTLTNSLRSRLDLICLSLARRDSPAFLNYAQELLRDMKNYDSPAYPDVRGLAALLDYFTHLQEKRVAEVTKAQSQVNELKNQLNELKSIEQIINERKNDN